MLQITYRRTGSAERWGAAENAALPGLDRQERAACRVSSLVIDREAIRHNIRAVLEKAGEREVYAVIKSNAYGVGLLEMAKLLIQQGVSRFAVSEYGEAAALRMAGFDTQDILLLRPVINPDHLRVLIKQNVCLTVGSSDEAHSVNAAAVLLGKTARVQLEVDTGMARGGFRPDQIQEMLSVFRYMDSLFVEGMHTHFHSACISRRATVRQQKSFNKTVAAIRQAGFDPGLTHSANSSALFRYGQCQGQAVRCGSALLGRLPGGSFGLKRVGYIETSVSDVRTLSPGQPVGYGGLGKTKRVTRCAVVRIGYIHGFGVAQKCIGYSLRDTTRSILSLVRGWLTGRSLTVWVNGYEAPVIGKVGMNHAVIDVNDIDCNPGDRITMDVSPVFARNLPIVYR